MTTAAEYRQFAQECVESAKAATNDEARRQFLDIAKLWLMAAEKIEAGATSQNADGVGVPRVTARNSLPKRGVRSGGSC